MDNLRATIELLFERVNPENLIQHNFSLNAENQSDSFTNSWFTDRFETLSDGHTKDEINAIHSILSTKWMSPIDNYPLEVNLRRNVFYLLLQFTDNMLHEENDIPVCEFSHLLRWHDLSVKLGEDLFTTSFLAYKDLKSKRHRHYFSWPSIISTNNRQLREILEEGIAELHFHLRGSSQNFDLNWVSLMNHITNRKEDFRKIRNSKMPDANPWFGEKQVSLYALCIKAFAIRQYLFKEAVSKYHDNSELRNSAVHTNQLFYEQVLRCEDEEELSWYISALQNEADLLRYEHGHKYGKEIIDYAIPTNLAQKNLEEKCFSYSVLYGERWLLYKMFHIIYSRDKNRFNRLADLFYAYLIIKERLRKELIQVNDYIGFSNFQEYQDRKEIFIKEGSIYEKLLVNLAVNGTMSNPNLKYLEARITPKSTAYEMLKSIEKYDKDVDNEDFNYFKTPQSCTLCPLYNSDISKGSCSIFKELVTPHNFYYIIHFIKRRENHANADITGYVKPRNHQLRKLIKEQTMAINIVRRLSTETKKRIVGVDAANTEIGCRPEVFAHAYRYLKNYSDEILDVYINNNVISQLGFTYHAGEDFLDIADGLRAIDEAISFLTLQRGDRLGHALALGINPYDYYEKKNWHVIMSKQDFLDNVVWILQKIKQYNIHISQALIQELHSSYVQLYHEIYAGEIGAGHDTVPVDIYSQSWLLRGDDPVLYLDDTILEDETNFNPATFWGKNALNNSAVVFSIARKNVIARKLYRAYHFNVEVKKRGSINDEFRISREYVNLMLKIQNAMSFDISKKHIVIEANPTSNKKIGTYNKKYVYHPIIRFFNLGLTVDMDTIQACPQLSVSLNTDDQGVFSTSLENEYALMAIGLEKEKDENNMPKYNSRMVYDWLNRIREMGFEQKFKRDI